MGMVQVYFLTYIFFLRRMTTDPTSKSKKDKGEELIQAHTSTLSHVILLT